MPKTFFSDEAEMFAHKAWETLELTPPVDLALVTRRLGVELCEEEFSDEIDGMYVRLTAGPAAIAINNVYTKPVARRRFTLAHEIGHHLLARRINVGKKIFFLDSKERGRSAMEVACNKFAVLLLMPEQHIRKHYAELEHNPSNRTRILADRFEVSDWAMRRRLRELALDAHGYPKRPR